MPDLQRLNHQKRCSWMTRRTGDRALRLARAEVIVAFMVQHAHATEPRR